MNSCPTKENEETKDDHNLMCMTISVDEKSDSLEPTQELIDNDASKKEIVNEESFKFVVHSIEFFSPMIEDDPFKRGRRE